MKKAISLIVICFCFLSKGYTQQTTDLHQAFLLAESYYLFEEFDEALPMYLRIHRASPDNYNIYFKIGVCYLNNPYEKAKSISYLEKAAENINPKYKDSNYKETGAPLDALFFLGNAYRANNELVKARDSYKKFQSKMDPDVYDNNLVVEQLAACDAAEDLMKKPVDLDIDILSNRVNTRFADKNPAVSGDETKMVFISKLQFYDAVFYTEKKNGTWTQPRNIIPELGVDDDVYPTCLSYDGKLLIVYRNDDFVGDLYISTRVDSTWTPLIKLNDLINTKFWESHASLTKDGNTLYFTSNRKGGYGGLDIYKSKKLPDGDWGAPVNLGPAINTVYNEETPFITESGRKLFFSSYGHYNMGGYDVFMSTMQADSSWTNPVNLGYPVNSTDDDIFFCPVKNGKIAYYPVYKETGYGKHDIYRYQVYTDDQPRRYDISGILSYSGEIVSGSDVSIGAIRQNYYDTLAMIHPDDFGTFTFNLPAGNYSMFFVTKNFEKVTKSLVVSQNTPHSGINLKDEIKLTPLTPEFTREDPDNKFQIGDTFYTVTDDKQFEINYEAEKGSIVIIRQSLNTVLVKIDTIHTDKRKQSFEFLPQPGLNKIVFILTGKDGIPVIKTVTVEYKSNKDIIESTPGDKLLQTEKADEKAVPEDNLIALVNELSTRADGRLREVLKNLDLQKENISSTEDLFKYLTENAIKLGYTPEEVDRLHVDMISSKDLTEFLAHLKYSSTGSLQTAIAGLDLKSNNINSPYMAIDYLVRNSKTFQYTPEDLITALSIIGSNGTVDNKTFINKLIHSSDEGEFKVYLKKLDQTDIKPVNPRDFAISLYRNSTGKSYTEADVLNTLTNLAVNRDGADIYRKLIVLSDKGPLKNFLTNLDLQKEGIYTSDELVSHLYANADLKDYTNDDVTFLLHKYTYNQVKEIDDLRLKMASLATGNLRDYLEKTNLNEHSFGSRDEFINFLYSEAKVNGFTVTDVNNTLLKLAYTGDLGDIIQQLILHSDGPLRKTILNLNPEGENITSFDELILYLLNNKENFGYSQNDVFKMLTAYTSIIDLKLFLNELIYLADAEIKDFLESIDPEANEIKDREQLISIILKKDSAVSSNKDKTIGLILTVTNTRTIDILPFLKSRSTGDLNTFLNSGKIPVNDLRFASELYDYLIEVSLKNKQIFPADINKLFSEYLINDALNQFLGQLIKHSDGKIRDFLQKINLKEAGPSTVSGLIQYLLSDSAQADYTRDDVFRLIEKVLGYRKLVDFVDNLKKFAPVALKKLLDDLDMEKAAIGNVEDLINYLTQHAAEHGFTVEDVWNSILQLVISGEDNAKNNNLPENSLPHFSLARGVLFTTLIFGFLGIIVLILIFIKRKKGK